MMIAGYDAGQSTSVFAHSEVGRRKIVLSRKRASGLLPATTRLQKPKCAQIGDDLRA
jgi:hypothetical protein